MQVKVRPLNQGETFCCSVKKAKEVFQETSIYLDFSYLGRDFCMFAESPIWYFYKKNIRGRVLSSMRMSENYPEPLLSFYVVKEKDFDNLLKKQYEDKFLPEYYRLYKEMTNVKQPAGIEKIMLVELVDGNLLIHESKL